MKNKMMFLKLQEIGDKGEATILIACVTNKFFICILLDSWEYSFRVFISEFLGVNKILFLLKLTF